MLLERVMNIYKQKEYIINILKSDKIFDKEILNKIENLVNRDNTIEKELIELIKKSNIPEKHAKIISNKAYEYFNNANNFHKYLKNKTLSLSSINETLISLLSETKINSEFIKWLIQYNWASSPAMGKGEIALSLLLKDASKSTSGGDIIVNNQIVEVKGAGGRLKGQSGYGSGIYGSKEFENGFNNLLKKLSKDITLKNVIPKAGGTEYNFNNKNWISNEIAPELISISNGKIKSSDIIKIYENAIKALFIDMNVNWVSSHIKNDGKINDKKIFIERFCIESIKYYMNHDGFNIIILLHPSSGKIGVITDPENAFDIIKIKTTPSFSSAAGPQGMAFAIDLK